jgi:hypothetical protein
MTDVGRAGVAPSREEEEPDWMEAALLAVAHQRAVSELGHRFGPPIVTATEERTVCRRCGDCYYHVPGNRYAYGSAIWTPCGSYAGLPHDDEHECLDSDCPYHPADTHRHADAQALAPWFDLVIRGVLTA